MTCPKGHPAKYCGDTVQGKRMMACKECAKDIKSQWWYVEGERLPEPKVETSKPKRKGKK